MSTPAQAVPHEPSRASRERRTFGKTARAASCRPLAAIAPRVFRPTPARGLLVSLPPAVRRRAQTPARAPQPREDPAIRTNGRRHRAGNDHWATASCEWTTKETVSTGIYLSWSAGRRYRGFPVSPHRAVVIPVKCGCKLWVLNAFLTGKRPHSLPSPGACCIQNSVTFRRTKRMTLGLHTLRTCS